jgi:hypothetical protein
MIRSNSKINQLAPFFLLSILAVSLCLNLYGINWGLPSLWHPDESATIKRFVIPMARNSDPNPHNFLKPSLYYYFLELVLSPYYIYRKFSKHESNSGTVIFESNVTLISRVITAMIGTASIFLLYIIGCNAFNIHTGLLSSLFLAITMGFSTYSHFAYMDIPMIFLILLMVVLYIKYLNTNKIYTLYLACFVGGLSISTKYNSALPVILVIFFCYFKNMLKVFQKEIKVAERVKALLPKSLIFSLTFVAIGFFVGTPFSLLDFPKFADGILEQLYISKKGYKGFSIDNALYTNFFYLNQALGTPLFSLSLGGLFLGFILFLKKPNNKIAILLSIPLIYYSYISTWNISTMRYTLPVIPFLSLWAAVVIIWLLENTKRFRMLISITTMLVVAYSLVYSYQGVRCFSNDTRVVARNWIRNYVPPGSKIEIHGYSAYLPEFSKEIDVTRIHPDFLIPSKDYDKYKEELKRNASVQWVLKIFGRTTETEDISIISDHTDNKYLFSIDSLRKRNPDYIVLSSLFIDRFTKNGNIKSTPYPTVSLFFNKLLSEEAGYYIIKVFEDKTPSSEWNNPTIILLKNASSRNRVSGTQLFIVSRA